jgi:PEP-CTERM motif
MYKFKLFLFFIGSAVFLTVPSVKAQLQMTLNPATQSYTQAQTATWNSTFLNTDPTRVLTFLGITFPIIDPSMTADDTLFLTNLGGTTLSAGASVTANIFTSSAPTITPGTYDGIVNIKYSFAGDPTILEREEQFTSIISAAAIPEPSTLSLCALGAVGVLGRAGARRKQ